MNENNYQVGSIIKYVPDVPRFVKVTHKDENIENDSPGFDGVSVVTGQAVRGYDDQIVKVVKF